MAFDLPAAVPSMGTRRVVVLPTVEDIEAITVTEVQAGTSKDISCYLTRQNGFQAGGDQAVIADGRYCSVQDFEQPGAESRTLNLQYVFNLGTPADDVARLTLVKGFTGTIVHFLQKEDGDEEYAIGDWYEAVTFKAGMQMVVPVEDNAVDRITQKAFITGQWVSFKQLVA